MESFLAVIGLLSLVFIGFMLGTIFGIALITLIAKIHKIKKITALLEKLRRLFF